MDYDLIGAGPSLQALIETRGQHRGAGPGRLDALGAPKGTDFNEKACRPICPDAFQNRGHL